MRVWTKNFLVFLSGPSKKRNAGAGRKKQKGFCSNPHFLKKFFRKNKKRLSCMNNTFVVKNPLVWCDFEFGWWKKQVLIAVHKKKQTKLSTVKSGRYQIASAVSTSKVPKYWSVFWKSLNRYRYLFGEKKRARHFHNTRKLDFVFESEMIIILKFSFP